MTHSYKNEAPLLLLMKMGIVIPSFKWYSVKTAAQAELESSPQLQTSSGDWALLVVLNFVWSL